MTDDATPTPDPARPRDTLDLHPLALLIPSMTAAEFAELKADVAANGLLHPVLVYEGKILDGRHRARAADELGLPLRTEDFTGSEADALRRVVSLNLSRRHLSVAQRAEIAAKMATFTRADASALGNLAQGKAPGPKGQMAPGSNPPAMTIGEAATLMGVSERSVKRAKANARPEGPGEFPVAVAPRDPPSAEGATPLHIVVTPMSADAAADAAARYKVLGALAGLEDFGKLVSNPRRREAISAAFLGADHGAPDALVRAVRQVAEHLPGLLVDMGMAPRGKRLSRAVRWSRAREDD